MTKEIVWGLADLASTNDSQMNMKDTNQIGYLKHAC